MLEEEILAAFNVELANAENAQKLDAEEINV
jgi:hypothetical protein